MVSPPPASEGSDARILGLIDASHLTTPAALPALVAAHADAIPGWDLVLYLTDVEHRSLLPLQGPGIAAREPLGIDTTVAGRAFRVGTPLAVDVEGGHRLWLPVIDGTARIGAMEVTVAAMDEPVERRARQLAGLAAELLVSKNNYGDTFRRRRRTTQMTLAAELQWSLLPPLTFSDGRLSISGAMEPSYEIGGDTFDYAINGDTAHFAIFDAMGHGFEAALMATVATTAYRHRRRAGAGLAETYAALDAVIGDTFGVDRFLTAQLAELDIPSGRLRWLNAGHHAPLQVRGGKVLGPLVCEPTLPVGFGGAVAEIAENALEPGDALLFFTDGVIEARSPDGEFFGDNRLSDFLSRATGAGLPAPETLRRLSHAILDHQQDHLQDDATTVYVEWMADTDTLQV